jgi:hypothetical protein
MNNLRILNFFNAINGANFNAQTAKGAAPGIDKVVPTVGQYSFFWTNQSAVVTRDA